MLVAEPRALFKKLTPTCTRALETAAGACVTGQHYEVTVEHLFGALLEDRESDVAVVLDHFRVDRAGVRATLQRYIGDLRSGNAGKPVFSQLLLELMQDAWVYGSTEQGEPQLRSGAMLVRLLLAPNKYLPFTLQAFEAIPRDELRKNLGTLAAPSAEASRIAEAQATGGAPAARKTGTLGADPDGPLARFTTDLTQKAKDGHIDPVFGREPEIRQVVDILVRRRKNNPIIVGDAGVGKTALVEGLAIRIAEGTVPEQLRNVALLSLDMGALQAGASMKGEFEKRLKGVIDEVKASTRPIILFIDEAHTLVGAGGSAGTGDAANLLKPALARGELRTVGATTWAEFKKYFEKDPALERRFQPVKVDEPSVEVATLMMRGVARKFEEAHGVVILDEAVKAAAELSSRYISGRQLPDKAVDLLDTSAARVKVTRAAPPAALEDTRAQLAAVKRQLEATNRDYAAGLSIDEETKKKAEELEATLTQRATELEARLADQKAIVEKIDEHRDAVSKGEAGAREKLRAEIERLRAIPAEELLIHADVSEAVVASVVGDWTGIPVGKMVKDEVSAIQSLEDNLKKRVRGQDQSLELIARELRAARSGLKPPQTPLGVFLLVGPSGVGKTESAIAIADLLFGGERFMVTINMSEFQERHTVSKLVGSPPGYVGYGEGGVLTEAVRQRPFSVVLLDEVEKADKEVLNVFYQVFDKGMLADGEGRLVDFKNTVIILTSNLATDLITNAAPPGEEPPALEDLVSLAKPTLTAHFKPALLARMTVVPYIPISPDALLGIAKMKLGAVVRRAKETHGIDLAIDEAVFKAVADRCKEVQSGARNVDHIIRGSILPIVSNEILRAIADGGALTKLQLGLDGAGELVCSRA
ncbi:MAG TPA: type VI secretion system ATPase TssH [Labilithrix sp.]|nr:type VI secretion system ATPase TssH [Labilithrix sp.]